MPPSAAAENASSASNPFSPLFANKPHNRKPGLLLTLTHPRSPETVAALSGNCLNLHNRILTLIRQNDLEEAALLTRHSNYSNCRPTIFTCNSVLADLLRQSRYSELLSLHRFITQAGVAANVITHNLLINAYLDCRKTDTALEHYKQLINDAPLIKGLVDNNKVDRAMELKDEMLAKEKLGGVVSDGVVYGNLMKGHFMRGMDVEAMECYNKAVGEDSEIRMSAVAFNSVLSKNGKFDEAMKLFKEAIEVFSNMGEKRCRPDTLSYNNLIEQLCENGMLGEAEELYKGMSEKGVSPDEFTFVLLMDSCFKVDQPDAAAGYFRTMVDSKLRPNLAVYNKLVVGLVEVGKVDEVKWFYDLLVGKLMMDDASYEFMMQALFEVGKADEVLNMVGTLLRDEAFEFSAELQDFVKGELSKEGREEELVKLMEDVEREKAAAAAKEAEAAEKAKASARAAVSSLLPSKLFGNKESEENSEAASENADDANSINAELKVEKEDIDAEAPSETDSDDEVPEKEAIEVDHLGEGEVKSEVSGE
ncbi:pentatricopeptide repeat (PPR) superfamily protein [Actinidia rufa]|uniref:Pentatricopeptide repeat (PPR) superfamily protein n=1 Tax=Actinidia rufa TaxID=165716 RepID=A0A7J0EC42_9ERIC|nr:pentatricopeptide repeat (PPR) superfamily protein [Actinidia rufa]